MREAGDKLVRTTYNLEGDEALAFPAYDAIKECCNYLKLFIEGRHPYATALCNKLSQSDDALSQCLQSFAHSVISPSYEYLSAQLANEYKSCLSIFQVARLCNPKRIMDIRSETILLHDFKYTNKQTNTDLLQELPTYLSKVEPVPNIDLKSWWKRNKESIPT